MRHYNEEELLKKTPAQLRGVITEWAEWYRQNYYDLVPHGKVSKEILIDTILECQEEKGGAYK